MFAAKAFADPRIIEAGEKAEVLYYRGVMYSNQYHTNGVISAPSVKRIARASDWRKRAASLVRVGLWCDHDEGWVIADFRENLHKFSESRTDSPTALANISPKRHPFTYFAQSGDGWPIKIGFSVDVDKRISEVQTGCPWRVVVLAKVEGGAAKERSMHERFAKDRIRTDGEWFHPSPELIAFIASLNQGNTTC